MERDYSDPKRIYKISDEEILNLIAEDEYKIAVYRNALEFRKDQTKEIILRGLLQVINGQDDDPDESINTPPPPPATAQVGSPTRTTPEKMGWFSFNKWWMILGSWLPYALNCFLI